MMDDEALMKEALHEAQSAFAEGEVPIGAVVAKDGQILGRGHNSKENLCDPTAHAEILALRQAGRFSRNWRLTGSALYVTAEPCLMCLGAALQARVATIVFGCEEPKFGALRLLAQDDIVRAGNHKLIVQGGILAQECAEVLRSFFETKRR